MAIASGVVVQSTTQAVNTVLAGPSSGGAAVPSFRVLVPADIPANNGVIDVTEQATPVLAANSAATNTANIATILAAVASGSTILFPPGIFHFATAILPGAKFFQFQGANSSGSGGATILAIDSATDDLFRLTDGNWYTTWADFTFAPGIIKSAGAIINTGTANSTGNVGTHIRRCNFQGALLGSFSIFNCIVFNGLNGANQTNVEDCFFTGFTNFGISLVGNTTTNLTASSLVFVNSTMNGSITGTTGAVAGIQVTQAGAVQIDNCDVIGCTNNLLINPAATSPVQGVFSLYCTNTYFDSSFGSCIKLSSTGNIERCRFIGCSFTVGGGATSYSAVEISSTATILPCAIDFVSCSVLNTFSNSGAARNGFLVNGCQDVSIQDCRIAGWVNGIQVSPSASSVTKPNIQNCVIGPNGNIALNTVGILINSGTYGSIVVVNNDLTGNTTAMTDSSTVVTASTANVNRLIVNNIGYFVNATAGGGKGVITPTVPTSTTAVFNPNGCTCSVWIIAGTLTVVKVGNTNTPYAAAIASPGIPVRVGPNQSLAVTYSVAPTWTWVPEG